MSKILIIIINYENEYEVLEYVKMISNQDLSSSISVVVVENKSGNNIDLLSELKKINAKVQLFKAEKNLGYLEGAFYGYNMFIETNKINPDWIVISNTDIEIGDFKFFNKLINSNYDKDIVCIAPSVISSSSNSYQNPYYKERLKKSKINMLILFNKLYPIAYLYQKLASVKTKFFKTKKSNSDYVYAAHGCFFILTNPFISKIYKNGYGGFLYCEELYIAEHILKFKKKCFYDSRLELVHNENTVTKFLSFKSKSRYMYYALKFIKENFYRH